MNPGPADPALWCAVPSGATVNTVSEVPGMVRKLFPANVHPVERLARLLVGIGLLTLAVVGPRTPLGFVGVLPLVTGLAGTCPAYTLLGVSTCRRAS